MNHKELYTKRIELKVSKKLREKLDKFAEDNDLTLNQVIRTAIEKYLK